MDDERVWLYAAMMVIYFIAWVLKKIKTRSEGKNEEETKPNRTLAEVQENRKRHLQRQAARDSASTADDASQALRQLFESIGGDSAKESFLPEAEPVSAKPPPLAKPQTPPPLATFAKKTVSVPDLTAAEKKALADLKSRENSPYQIRKKKRSHSLALMTRGRGLRQAVVLKELLDQPRALRPY